MPTPSFGTEPVVTGRSCRNLTVILQPRSQPSGRNGTFIMFSHCSAAPSAKSDASSGKRRLTTRTPCSTNDPRLRDITNPFMSLMTSSCSGCMRSKRYSRDACTTSSLIARALRRFVQTNWWFDFRCVSSSLVLSVGQLSFYSLLPGNGPSLINLNFLTAAPVTVRRSLMNKSLLCNFFWSVSNISRMSPTSEVIHFCWWFQILRNPLASAFSFLSLVLSGAYICSHTLMQSGSTASTSCSSCWANLTSWCRGNCLTFPACADNIFILLGVRKNRTSPSRLDFQMPSSGMVLTTDSMAKTDW